MRYFHRSKWTHVIPDLLAWLGYDAPERGAIILYMIDNGTTEGCEVFHTEEDRVRIEDLIPEATEADWEAANALFPPLKSTEILSLTC